MKKTNWFIRILIILYVCFLTGLVTFTVSGNYPPSISASQITILLIITLLILSESFDNFSLGKLFTVNREVKKKEQEIQAAKKENVQLRENLVQLTSTVFQNQAQHNNTFNGLPTELLQQMFNVVKVKEENNIAENENAVTEGEVCAADVTCSHTMIVNPNVEVLDQASENETPKFKLNQIAPFVEREAIDRYLIDKQLSHVHFITGVEISSAFKEIDPIAERKIIFDAYYKTTHTECFVEVKFKENLRFSVLDRLYIQLAKIMFYRQEKKVDAKLILLLADIPIDGSFDRVTINSERDISRFMEQFQPAIKNDLLHIETIVFTNEDLERWKVAVQEKQANQSIT